jgi:hypothetical protein
MQDVFNSTSVILTLHAESVIYIYHNTNLLTIANKIPPAITLPS